MGFPGLSRPPAPRPGDEQPPPGVPEDDWPKQATEQVVRLVDTVRDKTTGPVLSAAKGAVFGVVAGAAGTMMVVLLVIMAIRVLTMIFDGRVWITYLLLGVLFTLTGGLAWSRRNPVETEA